MSVTMRAHFIAFVSKRWFVKSLSLIVAVPIVLGVFAPIMTAATRVYG